MTINEMMKLKEEFGTKLEIIKVENYHYNFMITYNNIIAGHETTDYEVVRHNIKTYEIFGYRK